MNRELSGDLGQNDGISVDDVSLQFPNHVGRDASTQQVFDQRIDLLGREDGVDQFDQRGVVASDEVRMAEEPIDRPDVGRPEDRLAHVDRIVALAEDRVQVVRQKHEPRVLDTVVHRIVVTPAGAQVGLVIADQRLHGKPSQPLVDVDDSFDLLDVGFDGGVGQHVGKLE